MPQHTHTPAKKHQQTLLSSLQQRSSIRINSPPSRLLPCFIDSLANIKFSRSMTLLNRPRLFSSHKGSINTIDIDNDAEGRYILCGSSDATISIFDLMEDKDSSRIRPLAQSRRCTRAELLSEDDIPAGHHFGVGTVQWYPIDTGLFLSLGKDGTVLLWDTNSFRPAFHFNVKKKVACFAMPRSPFSSHFLAAVGCSDDNVVKLCDVTSGSHSHELVGHGVRGVRCVAWHPTKEHLLATGGDDRTVRLWDIRKSGSGSCLLILNEEASGGGSEGEDDSRAIGLGYDGTGTAQERKRKSKPPKYSPNDFSKVESGSAYIQSHDAAVSALAFSVDGQFLASAGVKGERKLRLWDLRYSNGRLCHSLFVFDGTSLSSSSSSPSCNRNLVGSSSSSLLWSQPGSRHSATIWYSDAMSNDVLAFDMDGGRPRNILTGHLDGVTCFQKQDNSMRLFSGARDGMILGWGHPGVRENQRRRKRKDVDQDCWDNINF